MLWLSFCFASPTAPVRWRWTVSVCHVECAPLECVVRAGLLTAPATCLERSLGGGIGCSYALTASAALTDSNVVQKENSFRSVSQA